MDDYGTPVMFAAFHGSAQGLRDVIRTQIDGRAYVNRNDTIMGVTPLMAACMRPVEDGLAIARVLLEYGADVNKRDSGPGSFPLFQAAQGGKTELIRFLLQSGADLTMSPSVNPTTTVLWIAAQEGHAAAAAEILKAAEQQQLSKRLLEQTNASGLTPCCVGIERGHVQIVGVLVKAGCDVRRASPVYYCSKEGRCFDPQPAEKGTFLAVQYPLDMSVRSHATLSCAGCGVLDPDVKQCGKCKLAMFCTRECQMKSWPLHKRCCSKLAMGRDMYGDPAGPFPMPLNEPYGFQDGFCESDHTYSGYAENYVRTDHAVWEYDAGPRGRPDWRRYPDDIEASLESLLNLGAPKYMYKPGDKEAEGMYESTRSRHPAVHVATRHVSFDGLLTEREVYTGASRSVRRNTKRIIRDDDNHPWRR
jgi:ankyrin repeat protein